MKNYSVDRIENGIAVVEYDGNYFEVRLENLPKNIKEGTVLFKNSDGRYEIDEETTLKRKNELNNLQNSLFNK